MREPEIILAIHDLNQRGGQDRSTLEIARKLGERRSVAIHAFSLEADQRPSALRFFPVWIPARRPALAKILIYHLVTAWRFFWLKRRRRETLICATGAASLVSDVVHVQFVHAAWAKRSGRETSRYHRVVNAYNRFTERLTFRKNKRYIAISAAVQRELEDEYGLADVKVVHHGVDTERFSPAIDVHEKNSLRQSLHLGAPGDLIFLYVGTYERKGLAVAMRALARLETPERAHLRLVAVGAGDQAKFRALAEELGVGSQIALLAPRSGIERYFRAADAFVFPTTYEPFGLVILEAMASGLPCVASSVAGAAELIHDGRNGLLLRDPAGVEELAAHFRRLLDPGARAAMAKAARATALTRDWGVVAQEYEAALSGLRA